MQHMRPIQWGTAVVAALAWLGSGGPGLAGDPIVFSSDQTRTGPVTAKSAEQELVDSMERLATPSPYDSMTPESAGARSRSRDPRLNRRAKLAREERENWLWYDKGELQERDEEERAFGISKYAIEEEDRDPGDKETKGTGTTLRESTTSAATRERDSRVPMHLRSSRQRQEMQARAVAESHSRSRAMGESESDVRAGRDNPDQAASGAHTARELDLRTLLGPAQSGSDEDLSGALREALRNNPASVQLRDSRTAAGDSQGGRSGLPAGLSPAALNLQPNFDMKQMSPLSSRSMEPAAEPRSDSGRGSSSFDFNPAGRSSSLSDLPSMSVGRPVTVGGRPPFRGVEPPRIELNNINNYERPRRGGTLGR